MAKQRFGGINFLLNIFFSFSIVYIWSTRKISCRNKVIADYELN